MTQILWKHWKILLASIITLCVVLFVAQTPKSIRSIGDRTDQISVFVTDNTMRGGGSCQLVFCVWNDGYAVWSKNELTGGPPYYCGQIPSDKIASLFRCVENDGYHDQKSLKADMFGPDSRFTSIVIRKDNQALVKMRSWHEVEEIIPGQVVLESGVHQLKEGQSRISELFKADPEYLQFRLAWAELRQKTGQLIPSTGTLTKGFVKRDGWRLDWVQQGSEKLNSLRERSEPN